MAGQAHILVEPDIESDSMMAKQLDYFADALAAGFLLGVRVPVAPSAAEFEM